MLSVFRIGNDCVVNMATPVLNGTGPPRSAPSRSNVIKVAVGVAVPRDNRGNRGGGT